MRDVWFTSDLHLGQHALAERRGFSSVEEHDDTIIYNLQTLLTKRSKLFILGDVTWHHRYLSRIADIPGIKELIIGNHDGLSTAEYLKYFNKVHGFKKYENFWISHCPLHPQEMFRCIGNIHGHIHNGGATPDLGYPYYNVNVDFRNYHPKSYDEIIQFFKEHTIVS